MLQLHFQLPNPFPSTPFRENWFLDTVYGLFILTVTVISFICVVWLKDQVRGCTLEKRALVSCYHTDSRSRHMSAAHIRMCVCVYAPYPHTHIRNMYVLYRRIGCGSLTSRPCPWSKSLLLHNRRGYVSLALAVTLVRIVSAADQVCGWSVTGTHVLCQL